MKIGTSIQPYQRAKVLKANLLYCIPGDRLTELAVHMIWGRYRISPSGEWFEDRGEVVEWFECHEDLVPLDAVRDTGLAQHYVRLGMSNEMRQAVEQWRVDNRDPDTGKVVSFVEALRQLIQAGLSHD